MKFKPEGDGNDFADFSVLNISVCFEVKAWAEGYPEGALRDYVKVAGAGRVVTVPQQKKLIGVSECRVSAHNNVGAHARGFHAKASSLYLKSSRTHGRMRMSQAK